ncbi:MAG TPA: cytochrome c [Acidobacteriota bacterium]|nr:cytochrome c [Acidobacteriota bacterium]
MRNITSNFGPRVVALLSILIASRTAMSLRGMSTPPSDRAPVFYQDILPILQKHCQVCHRDGGIGPMALVTYEEAKKWGPEIVARISSRKMPPWFADPKFGHFANDPSLTEREIALVSAWVESGADAGDPRTAPAPLHWDGGWNIPQPEVIVKMPGPVPIPAQGIIEYTYEIVPTGFTEDKWVQMSQVRPSSREHVHHAVVYIRPQGSDWLRGAPVGRPFTASSLRNAEDTHDAHFTTSDMLLVYAPGSSPDQWPGDMAKYVPAGSDLVFQMHYTTNGHAAEDQASVGVVFAAHPPMMRVITLQLTNDKFIIPPGADDYRVQVRGTLPNDAILLGFLPHMHLRGKRFEYDLISPDGGFKTLLRVNYDFYWQLSYRLAQPQALKAGTILQAVAWFDNSRNNPHNPDPTKEVRWGDQTSDEMMVGFFDIAVPAGQDKWHYFLRHAPTK